MSTTNAILAIKKSLLAAVKDSRIEEIKDLLLQLKKEVVATETLIRETKIGVAVNKLRQNENKAVADLAKDIVRKWKVDVGANTTSKAVKDVMSPSGSALPSPSPAPGSPAPLKPTPTPSTSAPAASTSTAVPSASASVSTPVAPPAAPKRRESLNGAPRTSKTDNVTFGSGADSDTGDKTRDKCVELVYNALASDSDAPTDLILQRAVSLEKYVHEQNPGSEGTATYRTKMRSLYLNLKAQNNPGLREDVVSGEIGVARLYGMSPAEMASEEQQAVNRKLVEHNLFKAQGAAPQQAETDAFQCGKCKQRRTMYYQMQTRSADEPMTTFVTCLNCSNRWKFS